jgi:predicted membrane-bound spermidine synthase
MRVPRLPLFKTILLVSSQGGRRRSLALLTGAYFLSGFSALLYQVVWQRLLGLFSGSDVRSATIVTGAYLAGLGVGSLIGAFCADRMTPRWAVRIFALCNGGIALFAILSRYLFYDLLTTVFGSLAEFPLLMLFIIFVGLLWPTLLMGLSLPLLSKALVRNIRHAGRIIGLLYGVNTFGAAVGTLVSGWYLVGTIGYERTLHVGAGLSLIAGLLCLVRARGLDDSGWHAIPEPYPAPQMEALTGRAWMWSVLVFTSGFIAISLELVWFRILEVLLHSNAYTFAHLLAFILIGYAMGSLGGARIVSRIVHPGRTFLWIQVVLVSYSILVIWALAVVIREGWLGPYMGVFREVSGRIDLPVTSLGDAWSGYMVGYLLLPMLILLPPNLLAGMSVPIVQRAVQTDAERIGRRVGVIQVSNILGNTAGSVFTGLVLLHFLGTSGTLRVIGVMALCLSVPLVRESVLAARVEAKLLSGLATFILCISVMGFPNTKRLWSWLQGIGENRLIIVAEDSSGVTLLHETEGRAEISIGGQTQGLVPYLPVHAVLGSIGALIHPDPKEVLVIGIGSSGTPYGAGVNPRTERIVAVEIVGSLMPVLRAYAREEGGRPLQSFLADARYNIVISDGRRELGLRNSPFDIIEADAILPWRSQSGFLYSREFFEKARGKLAEGGLMVQWQPTPRTKTTFMGVFPYGAGLEGALLGAILIGSNSPIAIDRQVLLGRIREQGFMDYWRRGGIDPSLFRAAIEDSSLSIWTLDTIRDRENINTDLFPKDEYYLNNE